MSRRALVVEDELMLVSVLRRVLRRELAFEVDTALNGREGLDKASAEPYDIILSDIRMPEMDGITMVRSIRTSQGPNAGTAIVMLTGYHTEGRRAAGELDTGFVAKPFRRAVLLEAIDQALSARPTRDSPT